MNRMSGPGDARYDTRRPRGGALSELNLSVSTGPYGHCVLDVDGELDLSTAYRLQRAVESLVLGTGLVIDLSGVTHCDSTGLTALVGAYRRTREEGTGMALCGTSEQLARVFQIVGIDRIVSTYDTVEQAATALSAPSGRAQ
jgi:anti-sigma B factor antagonist